MPTEHAPKIFVLNSMESASSLIGYCIGIVIIVAFLYLVTKLILNIFKLDINEFKFSFIIIFIPLTIIASRIGEYNLENRHIIAVYADKNIVKLSDYFSFAIEWLISFLIYITIQYALYIHATIYNAYKVINLKLNLIYLKFKTDIDNTNALESHNQNLKKPLSKKMFLVSSSSIIAVSMIALGWIYTQNSNIILQAKRDYTSSLDFLAGTDVNKAANLALKAAEQGNGNAQALVATLYEEGRGLPKSQEMALNWYRKAVAQDIAIAKYNLGRAYAEGKGVTQDYGQAAMLLSAAAEADIPLAQYYLGWMYDNGVGFTKNGAQAALLYERAAPSLPTARYLIGQKYLVGEDIPKNYASAGRWLTLAADNNVPAAQYLLGTMYEKGLGFGIDRQQALLLYRKAAATGYDPAVKAVTRVSGEQDIKP